MKTFTQNEKIVILMILAFTAGLLLSNNGERYEKGLYKGYDMGQDSFEGLIKIGWTYQPNCHVTNQYYPGYVECNGEWIQPSEEHFNEIVYNHTNLPSSMIIVNSNETK